MPEESPSQGLPEYFLPNMQKLSEKIDGCLQETRVTATIASNKPKEEQITKHDFSEAAKKLIPFSVSLAQVGVDNREKAGIALLSAQEVRPDFMRIILEDVYGKELAQTGIYEATDLSIETPISLPPLAKYFPEIGQIVALNKRYIDIPNNPFLTLLTLPVEKRAFFTGALLEGILNQEIFSLEDSKAEVFQRSLTLPQIMAYAKKVNELERVREYMDIYTSATS